MRSDGNSIGSACGSGVGDDAAASASACASTYGGSTGGKPEVGGGSGGSGIVVEVVDSGVDVDVSGTDDVEVSGTLVEGSGTEVDVSGTDDDVDVSGTLVDGSGTVTAEVGAPRSADENDNVDGDRDGTVRGALIPSAPETPPARPFRPPTPDIPARFIDGEDIDVGMSGCVAEGGTDADEPLAPLMLSARAGISGPLSAAAVNTTTIARLRRAIDLRLLERGTHFLKEASNRRAAS